MTKIQKFRIGFILILGIAVAGVIAYAQIKAKPDTVQTFGGAYSLTNHLGERVTNEDFAQSYKLIYFGFTFCPAICPTELNRMTQVLNNLPDDVANQIQPIFITIDPERDTVEAMKNYVGLFHSRFIGLTGTAEEINHVKDIYKIYANKVQDETMSDYTMDHSSYIYFIGPNEELIQIFKMDDSIDFIKEKIQKSI